MRALLGIAFGIATVAPLQSQTPNRVSRFGVYQGFSEARYDGWIRSSQYVTVRDGTRLAIDIYRPTRQGVVEESRLPVIWTHTPYYRANLVGDRLATMLDFLPWVATVLRHGYVVAAVDVRGTGASFGAMQGVFQPAEATDGYDITEWLAAQPWSSGNVGMFGLSYLGITQLLTAGQAPPHLKAIMPEMAWFDGYDFIYPGGIFQFWSLFSWSTATRGAGIHVVLPPKWGEVVRAGSRFTPGLWKADQCARLPCAPMLGGPVAPVDEDRDGLLLAAAVNQHLFKGGEVYSNYASLRHRNTVDESGSPTHYRDRSIWPLDQAIERSGIAIYHVAGWYDGFTRDGILAYHNLATPRRLTIGPWFHPDIQGYDKAAEALRWFDYWLKGIQNGVMEEDPIHYWLLNAPPGREWRSARQWPIPEAKPRDYFLSAGPSGTIQSVNDGTMSSVRPGAGEAKDDYSVDYTATVGAVNRWTATAGGAPEPVRDYPDLAANDRKGITYTSPPLTAELEVTGHPVVRIWISSDAKDVDVFAVLEEVRPDGFSDYVTEGWLRASHRALADPSYDRLGLPYHRSHAEDVKPLDGQPTELVFDLLPTAKLFRTGHRIRLTITGADHSNFATPVAFPAPRVTVYRGGARASRVTLPVVER